MTGAAKRRCEMNGGSIDDSLALLRSFAAALSLSLALVFAAAAAARAADTPAFKAGVFSPPRQAPDFSLQGSDGRELSLRSYRGKVVVLGFGFTSCPEVCPTTLATLAQTRRKLGAVAADVQVVYVTVDPERDDVERMKEYLAAFDPGFIGGAGTAEQLAAVRKDYGVLAEKKKTRGEAYTVAHSSYTYLIDRNGRLRALMPYGRAPDDYVHDLKILLNE
ncbi:MAG: SCO family protein [Steroidobacter sp.]